VDALAAARRFTHTRDRPPRAAWLRARLRAPWLDRELAAGIASWRSPVHAARALQLTSDRSRRGWAGSLERLVKEVEQPPTALCRAVVPPCREQVREARPVILAVASRLRSSAPVDARGVAQLRAVLGDGTGPCYVRSRPDTLTIALQNVSRSLDVLD
jgi:hypothetical protein